MFLYNLTLQKASAISHCIYGNFSAPKAQEIVVSRGKIIELLRPDDNGKIQTVCYCEIFGVIRAILPFRLTGGGKDYIVVASDSGRLVILEYNNEKNRFEKVHQETFGKSGCRRIVPGQWLAVDPKGRACMIGAVEKQKLVYILNRDSSASLTISSPLEAHKSHAITFSMCGLDVGFDNPIFVALEQDYTEENSKKYIVFYELDLGLNHVVRRYNDEVNDTSNLLIPIPGGNDGPGGLLVCQENYITFKNQGHIDIRSSFPHRKNNDPNLTPLIIVSYTVHKQKDFFFVLVQSELGDLYKISLKYKEEKVEKLIITYFDTVPVSNSLCVLKTGFLFVAAEFGNHFLYQFQSLGEDDDSNQNTDIKIEEDMEDNNIVSDISLFEPRQLKNLLPVDSMTSLSPIIDCHINDILNEENSQIYTTCGRGKNSTLRILRHGLSITEMAITELPGNPNAIWTVKSSLNDSYDKYIVVSFINATLVLSIGESVEEVPDSESGFNTQISTLHVSTMANDSIIQVYPGGIRHIRSDKRINKWEPPSKKEIRTVASNDIQVCVGLSGGQLVYFELNETGELKEIEKKDIGTEIITLDMTPTPKGRQRSSFLAVGDWENTVRILSLLPDSESNYFKQLSVQALPSQPSSVCIAEMFENFDSSLTNSSIGTYFLNVGLQNGVLMRTVLDRVTGELSDSRSRFLGSRPIKLFRIKVRESNAVLALSSKCWLSYNFQSQHFMTPFSYGPLLEYASNFTSDQCPEGIVAVSANTLRIIQVDKLGDLFNQQSFPLSYTPRKLVVHPKQNQFVIIESDNNCYSESELKKLNQTEEMQIDEEENNNSNNGQQKMDQEEENEEEEEEEEDEEGEKHIMNFDPKPGMGIWGSCVRLFDPFTFNTLDKYEFENNETATSLCCCIFRNHEGESFVVVATGKDINLQTRQNDGGFIYVFRIIDNKFSLLHKSSVEGIPGALCGFQGRLLCSIGKILRIYDLGKKKMLRKCENKHFPNHIIKLHTQGDRIIVGDIQESFHYVAYKKSENILYIFADESQPRWITGSCMLDYDTMAGSDKFGNIFVVRLPQTISEEMESDPTGFRWEEGFLNGAPHKVQQLCEFHIGETVSSLSKATLSTGGTPVIMYTTLSGALGCLIPFSSREDVDFFSHLEMHLRSEHPPLCGRDHLSFRSYYFPVKSVVDGDFCEQFTSLDLQKQILIAEELDRTPTEVAKKLEDLRSIVL